MKRLTITVNETLEKMIEDLLAKGVYMNASEVMRMGIRKLYEVEVQGFPVLRATTAEKKQSKKEIKFDREAAMCRELGGTVIGAGDSQMCRYKAYHAEPPLTIEEMEQSIPTSYITDSTFETQYSPSKDIYYEVVRNIEAHKKSEK